MLVWFGLVRFSLMYVGVGVCASACFLHLNISRL